MGVCRSCRSHVSGSVCPHCGGDVVEKKSVFSSRKSSSSSSSSNIFSGSSTDSDKDGCLLSALIGGKVKAFIRTYLICIILGIILTFLLQQNKIEFIKKYYNILQFVRIFCLMFGWIPAILMATIKK